MMKSIKKVLVANRGEIALRIMRSLKEMDISTVAIFSEADRAAPFVQAADQAAMVGPSPSSESYLKISKILDICRDFNVDAIHPGYGFLSENPEFASKATEAGFIFIGPSPESMEIMGSKLKAKQAVSKYNIPMVPGTEHAVTSLEQALEACQRIGFPILLKASAGGGGKGMRVVANAQELEEQMARAISEAESAFGDGSVFIEKFITSPRHIEVQILGDQQGNVIHLFERECSIQRRHQKVVEEAPSSILDGHLRKKMGEAAVAVAKSCNYYGAGTVEFMLDQNQQFYFLEMNTRLQVEHPVTELITGIDLVKEQVHIAEGKSLTVTQDNLIINGHAIESRVYAEDPANNFLPDIGRLNFYKRPNGPGVRVDDGFDQGMEIPIYYDPMIAKLIVHGQNREEAIKRMIRAIEEYKITGVETTLTFCRYVMQHPKFVAGDYNTKFVEDYWPAETDGPSDDRVLEIAAAFAALHSSEDQPETNISSLNGISSNAWLSRKHQD